MAQNSGGLISRRLRLSCALRSLYRPMHYAGRSMQRCALSSYSFKTGADDILERRFSRSKKFRRSLAVGTFILAAFGLEGSALAQNTGGGWALNRDEPTPAGDYFFYAEHPWYSSTRVFAAGIEADYSSNPLVLQRTFTDGRTDRTALVSAMLQGHVGAQVSFLDRIGIGLSLPFRLLAGRHGLARPHGAHRPCGRAGHRRPAGQRPRAHLRPERRRPLLAAHLGLGVAPRRFAHGQHRRRERPRAEPRLVMAGRASVVRWSLSAGLMLRSGLGFSNLAVGNELRFNAALGFVADDGRLTIGPEAYVVTSIDSVPQHLEQRAVPRLAVGRRAHRRGARPHPPRHHPHRRGRGPWPPARLRRPGLPGAVLARLRARHPPRGRRRPDRHRPRRRV